MFLLEAHFNIKPTWFRWIPGYVLQPRDIFPQRIPRISKHQSRPQTYSITFPLRTDQGYGSSFFHQHAFTLPSSSKVRNNSHLITQHFLLRSLSPWLQLLLPQQLWCYTSRWSSATDLLRTGLDPCFLGGKYVFTRLQLCGSSFAFPISRGWNWDGTLGNRDPTVKISGGTFWHLTFC